MPTGNCDARATDARHEFRQLAGAAAGKSDARAAPLTKN